MGSGAGVGAIVGGGLSALGTFEQGNAAEYAASKKEEADRDNATLAQLHAADALQKGQRAAGQLRQKGTATASAARVGYAASGIDENSGTAAQVEATSRSNAELDALTTMNNATRDAWGYKVQAKQFDDQAAVDAENEDAIGTSTFLTGFGQILGGAGSAAGSMGKGG